MASGDTRFFGFSGSTANPSDRTLGRILIPQAGVCRDLSTSNCPKDTAIFYLHYDKTTSPAVMTLCQLDNSHIIVDLSNTTYGTPSLIANGFQISSTVSPSGFMPISSGQLLATMDPPIGTTWLATGSPKLLSYTQDPTTGAITPSLPSACIPLLTVTSAPGVTPVMYNLNSLVSVPIEPFILEPFTSGTAVTSANIQQSFGTFPLRLFAVTLRIVGRLGDNTVGMRNCTFDSNFVMQCNGQDILTVMNISQLRLQEFFNLSLGASTASQYEILSSTQTLSTQCLSPTCTSLNLSSNSQIPVLSDNYTETFTTLDPSNFSLLKQEVMNKMRFVLWQIAANNQIQNQNQVEIFDVNFP